MIEEELSTQEIKPCATQLPITPWIYRVHNKFENTQTHIYSNKHGVHTAKLSAKAASKMLKNQFTTVLYMSTGLVGGEKGKYVLCTSCAPDLIH